MPWRGSQGQGLRLQVKVDVIWKALDSKHTHTKYNHGTVIDTKTLQASLVCGQTDLKLSFPES